jgi:hypothetical protein
MLSREMQSMIHLAMLAKREDIFFLWVVLMQLRLDTLGVSALYEPGHFDAFNVIRI